MEVTLAPRAESAGRRAGDLVGAVVLLALCLPVLVAVAAAVLVTSGRPVFFGHERIGRFGRPFRCWKFRTMVADAEERLQEDPDLRRRYLANGFKVPETEDPRITRLGQWLRRRHLDELPQLVNVLNGTMSLVGPRPLVREELSWYGDQVDELLSVRPGMAGEWASRGRGRPGYPERVELELRYVREATVRDDLRILVRTSVAVLRGQSRE